MDFILYGYSDQPYPVKEVEKIPTPRLLVFHDRVVGNIQRMKDLLRQTDPQLDLSVLCPHVKTHKSTWATQLLIHEGVTFFKCSPNEVEMLLMAGVNKIFIAYPLFASHAAMLTKWVSANPRAQFYFQASHLKHLDPLLQAARHTGIILRYFIDLDVGMHRTGIAPDLALSFYRAAPKSDRLVFAGLHAYDGHNTHADPMQRRSYAKEIMATLKNVVNQFQDQGTGVPQIVTGGTFSFLPDLELLKDIRPAIDVKASPGTWIYSDTKTHQNFPNTFEMAACILAQVIDIPQPDHATLNLGYKRWAIDQGPIEGFSVPRMKAVFWNEEHTVVSIPSSVHLAVGDYVLIAPRHSCATVNLWEYMTIISADGEIEIENCPIEGRNR
jgi:D-serine deaminase-like pyridoxal phosphate-dependent protein